MTFAPDKAGAFRDIFNSSGEKIRAFAGCLHLELWESHDAPGIFFTFSKWESETHLEAYRQSELFRNTWERTKVLFSGKPEAWTLYPA